MGLSFGVIGYGYWGPNLARNIFEEDEARLTMIADQRQARLKLAAKRFPHIDLVEDSADVIRSPKTDAVVIATPVKTHYALAKAALEQGKHVLIEKPLTASVAEAEELVNLAEQKNRTLMVDHTFVYTGAVRMIHKLLESGEIGNPLYFDSMRVNLGLFQSDVNVLWDLAPHDVSIMDFLFQRSPVGLTASGSTHFGSRHENIAFMTVFYPDHLVAHINVSWISPVKIRLMLIGGDKKMIVYDDTEPSEKVKVYDRGVDMKNNGQNEESVYDILVQYRIGSMQAPRLEAMEALRMEIRHFLDCVKNGDRPQTDGRAGMRVVQILEAAARSIKQRGAFQELNLE